MADDLRTRLLAVVAGCGEPICPICEKINEAVAALDERDEMLQYVRLQLEYLDERYPTGTTPAVIARIDHLLTNPTPEE